jgi:hypothetical protein
MTIFARAGQAWPEDGTLLPKPRVLRFGFLQDGNVGVGVGVFEEREELFVGVARPFRISRQHIRSSELERCQRG